MDLHLFSNSLLLKTSLGMLLFAGAGGCAGHYPHHGYYEERYEPVSYSAAVVVGEPPPPPIYEPIPAPRRGYVWIGGYYSHDSHGYRWRPGHYEVPPRRGAHYEQGHWDRVRGGYAWRDGRWR